MTISETGLPYVPLGWTGAVTHCADCGNDAADEPCKRVHNKPDAPLCLPCRLGQLYVHLFCWVCGGDKFLWCRTGIVEYAEIESFSDDDEAVIDDSSWTTDPMSGDSTWVECNACHTHLTDVSYVVSDGTGKIRQTACRHCGLDIEGTVGEADWRDRGNNSSCNDGKHKHEPEGG